MFTELTSLYDIRYLFVRSDEYFAYSSQSQTKLNSVFTSPLVLQCIDVDPCTIVHIGAQRHLYKSRLSSSTG